MPDDVTRHLARQAGVVSRRQALAAGLSEYDVRRLLRRHDWVTLHPGVYVTQTGPPSWEQRAWAACLWAWPAVLWGESALLATEGTTHTHEPGPVHVAVDRHRSGLVVPPSVRLHHVTGLQDKARWNLGPPRMRYETAVLDVAIGARSELDAIAVLAQACQSRRTTAARLLACLEERPRVSGRRWLEAVLRDVAEGTCSVLEHGYLTRVERPHGFPRADRQATGRASVGVVYRDVTYGRRSIIELDGRLFHDSATTRDTDVERDLDAAVDGRSTVRLAWGQVFVRPCRTAAKLAVVLSLHGVDVRAHPCGPGCPVTGSAQVA